MTRAGGIIVLIAIPHEERLAFNYKELFRKELELVGTRVYNDRDFEDTLQLLASGKIDAERLITDRVPLAKAVEAIAMVETNPETSFKVLLKAN